MDEGRGDQSWDLKDEKRGKMRLGKERKDGGGGGGGGGGGKDHYLREGKRSGRVSPYEGKLSTDKKHINHSRVTRFK